MTSALIVGGDSDYNLGDAAILAALCHSFARAQPRAAITVTSRKRVARALPAVVRTIPRGWRGARELTSCAAEQDVIVVGGGGLFQDDDSRAKMPFWAGLLAALRLRNRNLVAHCVGAGPLRHAESRRFAQIACSALSSITVRDEFARGWLAGCTRAPIEVIPDPAFMLPAAPEAAGRDYLRSLALDPDRPLIGVALRRWFHPRGGFLPRRWRAQVPGHDRYGRAELADLLAQVSEALRRLATRLQASIVLMPTYNVAHEADAAICAQLASHLRSTRVALAIIEDPSLYKSVAGHLELMVSARMHPLILAAGMGVPIVGLAYNGKFEALFDLLGLPRRVLRLDDFAQAPQVERLEQLGVDACGDETDLEHRCAVLAGIVDQRTAELIGTSRRE